ncbi:MAG TPA: LLM class flavin-dependent oxidoreductase, partial [Candidatus Acidoferrales bacterium]|nr:LLM class flavin-dependent oxidoreductase [Candidatus Acidoferrales bacterium]
MHIMYFTERPYRYVPNDEVIKNGFFGIPNKHFDPVKGSQLLNEYLDEKTLAEDLGFDGVMLNEHHDTAFCMGSVMDVEASILARITKRVKIILLGNPLPVVGNPLRLAEELSMIDMISRGRLVTGWVRGAGSEQFATNANPGYNREYFNEAHDLVVKAWTQPGPWRYEGKHYHYRFVDPWVLPIQKPHPPIWIPGLLSPETVVWCAEHRYPYIALATFLEPTVELWNIYRDAAARVGYQVGPENFGYLQKVYVAETDEKAREIAKWDMFGGAGIGYSLFGQPQWMFPPGYNSREATRRVARQ